MHVTKLIHLSIKRLSLPALVISLWIQIKDSMDQLQNKTTCRNTEKCLFCFCFHFGRKKCVSTVMLEMILYQSSPWLHRCCTATYGRWAASPSTPAAHRGSGLCSECCQADPEIYQQGGKESEVMDIIVVGHQIFRLKTFSSSLCYIK